MFNMVYSEKSKRYNGRKARIALFVLIIMLMLSGCIWVKPEDYFANLVQSAEQAEQRNDKTNDEEYSVKINGGEYSVAVKDFENRFEYCERLRAGVELEGNMARGNIEYTFKISDILGKNYEFTIIDIPEMVYEWDQEGFSYVAAEREVICGANGCNVNPTWYRYESSPVYATMIDVDTSDESKELIVYFVGEETDAWYELYSVTDSGITHIGNTDIANYEKDRYLLNEITGREDPWYDARNAFWRLLSDGKGNLIWQGDLCEVTRPNIAFAYYIKQENVLDKHTADMERYMNIKLELADTVLDFKPDAEYKAGIASSQEYYESDTVCKTVQGRSFLHYYPVKKGQTIKLLYTDEERQTFYADIDGVKGYLYSGNYFG